MDNVWNHLDWSLVRAFLAVAETGSLSAAARDLKQSQPTLGRQIKSLEAALGQQLFTRQSRGFELTDQGAALLDPATQMRAAFQQMGLQAAGQDQAIKGTVRIAASVVMAHYVLPDIIAHFRRQEPDIQIELVPNDASENLLFQEADIAVRMYRSSQLDVITKQVGETEFGVFGAQSYFEGRSIPKVPNDLLQHDLIGFDRDDRILKGMRLMGWPATRDWFAIRSDAQANYWELIRAGCGVGFGQVTVANKIPNLMRVLPEMQFEPLPVWLAAPEIMRHTPRIRRVWDALEDGLRPFVS